MSALVEHRDVEQRASLRDPEIALLTVEAPAAGVARFLAAGGTSDALLWAPSHSDADGDGWSFAGLGVAARAEAAGPDRVVRLRHAAARMFSSVKGACAPGDPPLRLFGGFSFREGEDTPGAWSAFGEASFTLPRFLYAERAGRAWLRAAIPVDEPGGLSAAVPALYRLRALLAAPAEPLRPPSILRTEELAQGEWTERVTRALDAVRGAQLDKVVLARRTRVDLSGAASLGALVASLPAEGATRFALGRRGTLFVGATPERLVSLCDGRIRCDALGGSAPRGGGDPDREASALRASAKDGREHAEVVAGIRGALAGLGSELATDGPRVRTLATVHHLHTEVTGAAHPGVDVLSLVEALHPTPAVCGSPRAAARAWIAENEGAPRGWYAGPIGWVDASGEGSFCVALRCALLSGREAWLYAGAGLVEGSDAAAEWRETAAKQAPMLRALGGRP